MEPGRLLLQRSRELAQPIAQLLTATDAHTFESRFDAFEDALHAWNDALNGLDKDNSAHAKLAKDVLERLGPRFKEIAEKSKELGATKGHKEESKPRTTGARRLKKTRKGRRARKGTRRGRSGRS